MATFISSSVYSFSSELILKRILTVSFAIEVIMICQLTLFSKSQITHFVEIRAKCFLNYCYFTGEYNKNAVKYNWKLIDALPDLIIHISLYKNAIREYVNL